MAIDPKSVAFFFPPDLSAFKNKLFNQVGARCGRVIYKNFDELRKLPDEIIPAVGCHPGLTPLIREWRGRDRKWIYWDRGYMRRVFATDLPRGDNGGYYRWHLNAFQMLEVRDVPDDRWKSMKMDLVPWEKDGDHVVVASPSPTYEKFHAIEGWTERTVSELKKYTDRRIVIRDKEMQRKASDHMPGGRRLWDDCMGAHALVTHGSNAAVEAAIMGCPVFVDQCSAAALIGLTDLREIEHPIYPDREPWVRSLCYNQFNEQELIDGTLWRMIN